MRFNQDTYDCINCGEEVVCARLFDTWAGTQDWDEQPKIDEWTHLGRGIVCSVMDYQLATPPAGVKKPDWTRGGHDDGTVVATSDSLEMWTRKFFGYDMFWVRCADCGWKSDAKGDRAEVAFLSAFHECES